MKDQLDELLAAGVGERGVPGVAAVVVDRGGVVYQGAFGERALGAGAAMTPDTVGRIASMTKAITGAAAMQLVEQGRLGLDDPAADVCPELGEVEVLEGFTGGDEPILRAPEGPVTLRHLLTHTSGFVYDLWNPHIDRYVDLTGTPRVFSRKKAALRVPLAFDPGTRWEYGIGIDWAGQMVERVSGQTLGRYFADHLTGPLGMVDTGFEVTPSMEEREAGVHARTDDGGLVPTEMRTSDEPEFEMGGGGLHSTVLDYGRFVRMILGDGSLDGTRVLQPETVTAMAANNMGELRVTKLVTVDRRLSNDAEFFPGDPKSWGLTFQINEVPGSTGRPAGTLMWAGLTNCYYWIDRTSGIGGAYLTQILPFADPASLGLYYDFETAVYTNLR